LAIAAPSATAARADKSPRYIQLAKQQPPSRGESDAFLNYDNASISKVHDRYEDSAARYSREGNFMYLPWKSRDGGYRRYDSDKGKKTDCNSSGRNEHFRAYANYHNDTGRFYSRDYGYFVVASAHYDHGDGCPGRRYFGFSENVEFKLVEIAPQEFSWSVKHDHLPLRNYEEGRWEPSDHYWKNDGRASILLVP
jgi:hypothetical protein